MQADTLAQIRDKEAGASVCRDLAHLYHYYLHGPAGNAASSSSRRTSTGRDGEAAAEAGSGPGETWVYSRAGRATGRQTGAAGCCPRAEGSGVEPQGGGRCCSAC